MKRCVIMLFLLCTATAQAAKQSQTLFLSRHFGSPEQAQITLSKKSYFLFDLHGVLFDRGEYVKALKKIKQKKKFLKQGIKAVFSKKARAAYRACKRAGNKITECTFDAAKEFKHLHQELIDFSNNIFSQNKQMLRLLTQLKDRGHHLYLCSNIGNVSLERLVLQHPTFFSVMNSPKNTINRCASTAESLVWKPQIKAYKQATTTIGRADTAHLCIFVDDQLHNVKAAHEAGLNAIHYTSYPQFFRDINALLQL